MPSKFFKISSKQLKHHSVTLIPDVEQIVRISQAHFGESLHNGAGFANFSTTINLVILTRFSTFLAATHNSQKPDEEAAQFLVDIINHKRKITDKDLEEYKKALDLIAYRKINS